jgi:hypothetical protein
LAYLGFHLSNIWSVYTTAPIIRAALQVAIGDSIYIGYDYLSTLSYTVGDVNCTCEGPLEVQSAGSIFVLQIA